MYTVRTNRKPFIALLDADGIKSTHTQKKSKEISKLHWGVHMLKMIRYQ